MIKRAARIKLVALLGAICGLMAVAVHGYSPPNAKPVSPSDDWGESECSLLIDGGNCVGGNATGGWGVFCSDTECTAWTNCANGSRVTCNGDYRGSADQAGVTCQDTGSDHEEEFCTR